MSDNPTVTREGCEVIISRPPVWLCTKCGWYGNDTSKHLCTYSPIDCWNREKRLARAYLALLESSEKDKAEAVAAERERCAGVAYEWLESDYSEECNLMAREIAAAIKSGE